MVFDQSAQRCRRQTCRLHPRTICFYQKHPSALQERDEELEQEIMRIYQDNRGVYGARKIHHRLLREGFQIAWCSVVQSMRQNVARGKIPCTTRSRTENEHSADLVNRTFSAERLNQLWVADITYVKTYTGWVYAVFVVDVFSPHSCGLANRHTPVQ